MESEATYILVENDLPGLKRSPPWIKLGGFFIFWMFFQEVSGTGDKKEMQGDKGMASSEIFVRKFMVMSTALFQAGWMIRGLLISAWYSPSWQSITRLW